MEGTQSCDDPAPASAARLAAALAAVPAHRWISSPVEGSPTVAVRWLPILRQPGKEYDIGLTEEGRWTMRANFLLPLTDQRFVPMLPFLEIPRAEFERTLREAFVEAGLPANLTREFPYLRIVCTALESMGDYWARLAVERIDAQDLHDHRLLTALRNAMNAPGLSLFVRHAAWRLVRRHERRDAGVDDLSISSLPISNRRLTSCAPAVRHPTGPQLRPQSSCGLP